MKPLILASLVFLAGCFNPTKTPYSGVSSDAVGTAAALATGATEVGPLAAIYPPVTIPLAIAGRWWFIDSQQGKPNCTYNVRWVDGTGWGLGCTGIATAIAGPTLGVGALAFLPVCGIVADNINRDRINEWCKPAPCNLSDLPKDVRSAKCINGKIHVIKTRK